MPTLAEIAARLHGTPVGDPGRVVDDVATPEDARPGLLCAAWEKKVLAALPGDVPVLAPRGTLAAGRVGIEVDDPRAALAELLPMFHPARACTRAPQSDRSASCPAAR